MVVHLLSIEQEKKRQALILKFQEEVYPHFFDYAMLDVNDALTSILAICDMEGVKSVSKVKAHIQRVNELMDNVKTYQNSGVFNINHVLKNMINLFRRDFKGRVHFTHTFSIKRALSSADKNALERLLIEVLVSLLPLSAQPDLSPCHISLDLCQLAKHGQVTVTRKDYQLAAEAQAKLKEISREGFTSPEVRIKNGHTEVYFSFPLHFSRDFSPLKKINHPSLPESDPVSQVAEVKVKE